MLASNTRCGLLHRLGSLLCLCGSLSLRCSSGSFRFCGCLRGLLQFFSGSNGLFSLSLANLWFLSPLGPFFGDIGFNTLIVFPSVENRPCHFSWISFEKMSTMTSTIQKFKHLSILLD